MFSWSVLFNTDNLNLILAGFVDFHSITTCTVSVRSLATEITPQLRFVSTKASNMTSLLTSVTDNVITIAICGCRLSTIIPRRTCMNGFHNRIVLIRVRSVSSKLRKAVLNSIKDICFSF